MLLLLLLLLVLLLAPVRPLWAMAGVRGAGKRIMVVVLLAVCRQGLDFFAGHLMPTRGWAQQLVLRC